MSFRGLNTGAKTVSDTCPKPLSAMGPELGRYELFGCGSRLPSKNSFGHLGATARNELDVRGFGHPSKNGILTPGRNRFQTSVRKWVAARCPAMAGQKRLW